MRQFYERYTSYVVSPVKSHTAVPAFVSRLEGLTGFSSLYAVTEETAEAIVAAGTTRQFKGVVWSPFLWIDVDNYDHADRAESTLRKLGLGYSAYDSGGRGVHFRIEREAVPSHLLPAQDKAWVTEHFPEADPSIYSHLHLFRLEGTIHETHGRPKALVETVKGGTLPQHPPLFTERFSTELLAPTEAAARSVFECFRVMRDSRPVPSGERHHTLVRLCYGLRDDAKVNSFMALWWLGEVNKMFSEPKSPEDLEHIVRSIYG
jgi:hypothetical protein